MARRVFEYIKETRFQPNRALDLCAGCGVIGLDLLFHLEKSGLGTIREFDFLEVQLSYEAHFNINRDRLGKTKALCRFQLENYGAASDTEEYDLIVCNPPYFDQNQGLLPPSELKLRSRFFVDSDLPNLIWCINRKLSRKGQGFILARSQFQHGIDQIKVIRDLCQNRLQLAELETIRGTHLLRLSKG